jgi:hypothetical protein
MPNNHHTNNKSHVEATSSIADNLFYRTPEARWHSSRATRKNALAAKSKNSELDEALKNAYKQFPESTINRNRITDDEMRAYVSYAVHTAKLLQTYRSNEAGDT